MATYTCPHCNKVVKNLKDHIRRMHPDAADTTDNAGDGDNNTTDDTGAETLEIEAPPGAAAGVYHCVDCGGPLTKGQTPCPACGAGLDWEAVA